MDNGLFFVVCTFWIFGLGQAANAMRRLANAMIFSGNNQTVVIADNWVCRM